MAVTLTSVDPVYGPIAGGTTLTLTVAIPNITDTYTVAIGGVSCTNVTAVSTGVITCVTGAATSTGPQNIVLTDTTASLSSTLTNGFAYLEPGVMCLQQLVDASKQRANMENSNFITYAEWTSYINQSAYELYDLLITAYGNDYYCAPALQFSTTGLTNLYALPNGVNYSRAPAFYKLMGVDLQISGTDVNNASSWVTLKPFKFSDRNKWAVPSTMSSFWGFYNMHYRLNGSNILFQPTPAAGITIQLWYIPRLTELVNPTDVLDGISGWTEYIIVDAAIKALVKEESETTALMLDKAALEKRINSTAEGRDVGFPQRVSDTQSLDWRDGGNGNDFGSGFGTGNGY